jgi:retron-type reverse transcriptase
LLDRIAQQVKKHLEQKMEPLFHQIPMVIDPKSTDAVRQSNARTLNHDFAIDIDIKGFFDNIDHNLMMKSIEHYCKEDGYCMYLDGLKQV